MLHVAAVIAKQAQRLRMSQPRNGARIIAGADRLLDQTPKLLIGHGQGWIEGCALCALSILELDVS